jgi:hypothetical protein
MARRFFNGLEIDVPDGWADKSTVMLTRTTINLVVKRRPAPESDLDASLEAFLAFMGNSFGPLEQLQTKTLDVAGVKGKAVRFLSSAEGRRFVQTTLLYRAGSEEISATVTQLEGDTTSADDVERMLKSVRPATAPMGWR